MAITARAQNLKERCISKSPISGEYGPGVGGCMERARYWTQAYRETEGEPEIIRRARALERVLDNMTIFIKDGELLVGYSASQPQLMPLHPEMSYQAMDQILAEPYIKEEDKQELREIVEYWRPRTLHARVEAALTPEERHIAGTDTAFQSTTYKDGVSSAAPDYDFVLQHGLNGIIGMLEEKLAEVDSKLHDGYAHPVMRELLPRSFQYQAMLIVARAAIRWTRRYSELAAEAARRETNPARQAELDKLARVCATCLAEPPQHLHEAMQAQWFFQVIYYAIERISTGAPFKPDHTFWPYYEKDVLKDKILTRDEAQELFELWRVKYAELGRMGHRLFREIVQGAGEILVLTIGGQKSDGTDACNELTEVILDATRSIRNNQPSLAFRWHPRVARSAMLKALECIRAGLTMPSFKNDMIAIPQLIDFGATIEEARHWGLVLCMSPGLLGRKGTRVRNPWTLMAAKGLDLALNDGYDPTWTKSQLGPHTGDASKFTTYEEVLEAFHTQVRAAVQLGSRVRLITRCFEAQYLNQPFLSLSYEGCIENGVDAVAWDEIPNPWINVAGGIDAADALATLKKLVFEEKRYTMAQVVAALKANWQGYEGMRQEFINDAPKFGNDDDYADFVAKKDVFDFIVEECKKVKNYSGASPRSLPQSVTIFWAHGRKTGALPNGRLAGEPLADGGVSPYIGYDKKGPTAVLQSVAKMDHTVHKGMLLNQRLAPASVKGDKGAELWLNYMKTWGELGIDHVQFNVVDTAVLRAAQKEPEKYPDLVVRIAGYSAYWNELNKTTQEAIIARTEQMLA